MKQHKLFQRVVAVILFSFLLVGCSMYLSQDTSSPTPVDAIQTSKPTFTPTVSKTLSPSVTPSRRPTATATPFPAWVTDFAEPILTAIANRPPDFQEDFSQASTAWQQEKIDFPTEGVISDGVLILSAVPVNGKDAWDQQSIPCCLDFKTFVLRVDVNTEKLLGEQAANITY